MADVKGKSHHFEISEERSFTRTRTREAEKAVGAGPPDNSRAAMLKRANNASIVGSAGDVLGNRLKERAAKSIRARIHRLIDVPGSSRAATIVFGFLVVAIAASTLNFYLRTVPQNENLEILSQVEAVCAAIFTVEVILRTFVATLDLRRMLLFDPFYWIDLSSIVPFYVGLGSADEASTALKVLQLLRLLRTLKLMRHYSGWQVLIMALRNSWRAMLVPM